MSERDRKGRFAKGNTISHRGWQAMVDKHFEGDEALARLYWGKVGAATYARQSGAGFSMELKESFRHPGTPEEFVARIKESRNGQSGTRNQVCCAVGSVSDLPF